MMLQDTVQDITAQDATNPSDCYYLILGNGFDLECGLPTKYTDFLGFISQVDDLRNDRGFTNKSLNRKLQLQLEHMYYKSTPEEFIDATDRWQLIIENYWFRHFLKIKDKDNWVDFEDEIARVIRKIEECMNNSGTHEADLKDEIAYSDIFLDELIEDLEDTSIQSRKFDESHQSSIRYQDLCDTLIGDLESLILGFEDYLREYVMKSKLRITDNITQIASYINSSDTCRVLTFNYTNTLERVLAEEADIEPEKALLCYVHGRVRDIEHVNSDKLDSCMVLGIDEHLKEDERHRFLGFSPFHKIYQRIFKRTESYYLDWLGGVSKRNGRQHLLIFGHSMGVTDRDILKQYLTYDGMDTTIFYHDDKMLKDQIANLIAILSPDQVMRMTGGKSNSLRFERQYVDSKVY